MTIDNANRKKFRAIGHKLKPIITIADKGLTENIEKEINRALEDHELIKLKLVVAERDEKKRLADSICTQFKAECVQSIGNILLLYRAAKKPDPKLSNLKRLVS
jgi:RNA-binding protein